MLGATADTLRSRADGLRAAIGAPPAGVAVEPVACAGAVGGGALPLAELPSWAVAIAGPPAEALERALRAGDPPIVARIHEGRVLLDVRTIAPDELAEVARAVAAALAGQGRP
jgi:L-seryl-tRNA(Ser) seleniumtransferase